MKKILLMLLVLLSSQVGAREIADVKLDNELMLGSHQVVLSGSGLRTKFFIKVYVASLYLGKKESEVESILIDAGAKRMSFHLLRDVSGKQVLDGINEAILPNNSEEEMKVLEARLYKFSGFFKSVPEIKEGEVVNLDYLPELGTVVTINNVEKGRIEGADFYRAMLKIWIGKRPVQASLKKSILGEK